MEILIAFENLLRPFGKHDRRERPECLPVLNPFVQFVLHFGRTWIRQDAAATERAGAELGAALKPAEHMAFGKQLPFRGIYCRSAG